MTGNQVAGKLFFNDGSLRNTISNNQVDGVGDGPNTGDINVNGGSDNLVRGNHAVRLLFRVVISRHMLTPRRACPYASIRRELQEDYMCVGFDACALANCL